MKILYGVQGTGNGHITRARALSAEFAKANIDVDYVFSGRHPQKYFNMEPFGDYRTLTGLTFFSQKGQVQYIKTALANRQINFIRDIQTLQLEQYDLVVTDFEPVTAWAARLHKKNSIGIGHQYAFAYQVPISGSNWINKFILKHFAPATITLGLHWHHFNNPILPPIVEPVTQTVKITPGKLLVYLPFEDLDEIYHWLEPETDYEFYVYHDLNEPEARGHIQLLPLSRIKFKLDLLSCEGVISNSGFVMSSEAIQLGKKILTKPLLGQVEQISNAAALKMLGRANVISTLDRDGLRQWLTKSSPAPVHYPNVAREIVEWIKTGQTESLQSLSTRLWENSVTPRESRIALDSNLLN